MISFKSILPFTKHKFEDLFEEANYKITLRFSFFLCISLILLYLTQFISYDLNRSNLILFATVVSFIFYFYTLKTGEYKKPALIGSYVYAIIIEISLYSIPKNPTIIAGIWMINNIFFTFRCVNKKNGILLTIIHCFSISSYYLFNAQQLGEPLLSNDINLFDRIGICFNLLFAFLVFLFFIHQTIDTNIKASLKIKNINQEIFNQFEIINQQNEEKTILLKEIHHRVKNNLQIIISLLRLQSYQIEDSESLQSFNEAINRIMAISSIHEKIYQNDSFANIKIEEYFNDLIREIISNSTIHSKIETTLTFEVESIKLNPIVPLALIINELISNSIKHYDEKNQKINIELKFKKVGDKNLQITYSDNGVWKESTKKNTLGIELITALTKQINGNLILTKNPSTKYVFDFENII